MTEANKDEADKCKSIARTSLAGGDAEKAIRFLQKAKRMCPDDASIDGLIAKAESGDCGSAPSSGGAAPANEGPRQRAATTPAPASARPGAARVGKDGGSYTPEQMQLVQRILRTKDYYTVLDVDRNSNEDVCKKAYKKLALKLHPDKNKAPGAEEAFKKLSKVFQCLSDKEKKHVYDQYGDEDKIPTGHRHQHQQDFMTPEDLFAAFFGGGSFQTQQRSGGGGGGENSEGRQQVQGAQLWQMLPILLLVLMTLASNFGSQGGSRFSFTLNNQYRNERTTPSLNTVYFVMDEFDDHYQEGTRTLAEFERQVEVYYVRQLHSDCDMQEKQMYKKVMIAKRRGNTDEVNKARQTPRPKCKEMERIKSRFSGIYRSAMYMG